MTAPPPASPANPRLREDPEVAQLVQHIASLPGGVAAYNRLLMGLDWLRRSPDLLFRRQSRLAEVVAGWPEDLHDYFGPQKVPDWVDDEKLRRASRIWEENSVSLLFILFAASLPACYLLHRGIPALYRTGKLAKREYLAQRLYETGLMVDDVLDLDGIRVVEDHAEGVDAMMVRALRQAGLEDGWRWEPGKHAFVRRDDSAGPMDEETRRKLGESIRTLVPLTVGSRYLCGRGVMVARKVRLLHGYMRYMLMNPDPSSGVPGWDTEKLGLPVNQEDQAYTLLTFGYVMAEALGKLGNPLSLEDREAFLHRWRVVGHLMGVEDGLLTDRWDEAVARFEEIKGREAGRCSEGIALTSTLVEFLQNLLPDRLGLSRHLPVQFVAYFLGADADLLLSPELKERSQSPVGQLVFQFARLGVRVYFVVRHLWRTFLPGVPAAVTSELHVLAEELIEGMWSGFERNPFYLPRQLNYWRRDPDASAEFLRQIRGWQVRMFDTILLSVGFWVLAALLFVAAVALAVFQRWGPAAITAFGMLLSFWAYGDVGHRWVAEIRARRPIPPDTRPAGEPGPGCRPPEQR